MAFFHSHGASGSPRIRVRLTDQSVKPDLWVQAHPSFIHTSYDGDGKRIKKIVPNGEAVIFVYDAAGKLIAEYANQTNQTPQISYLTNDHLGSPRINTDAAGNIIARHDYHPFGEEIVGTGGRTQGLNYTADEVRKQFTGYERDTETDLDFAEARYYKSNLARYNSIDPLMSSAEISLPQTFNRYIYVANNPMNLVDPTGTMPECPPEQICQKDDQGNEYYIENERIVYVTAVGMLTVVAETVKETVKETIIEPKWWEMAWYYTKKKALNPLANGIINVGGKVGGAALFILTNPLSTSCGASPGMNSDGNGGCIYDPKTDIRLSKPEIDTSANPDPDGNTPSGTTKKEEKGKKKTKKTNKEKGSDTPSWARGKRPLPGERPRNFADRIMDQQYGPGNYPKGPGSEHNKLKKFAERLRN